MSTTSTFINNQINHVFPTKSHEECKESERFSPRIMDNETNCFMHDIYNSNIKISSPMTRNMEEFEKIQSELRYISNFYLNFIK